MVAKATVENIEDLFHEVISLDDLEDMKIDINVQDKNGNTFWHYNLSSALERHYYDDENYSFDLIEFCFDTNQKVNLSIKNNAGISVLGSFITDNNKIFDLDKILNIECFTDLDYTAQNSDGLSFLMSALRQEKSNNCVNFIQNLCSHPEILNLQDKYGNTALHYACQEEYHPSIEIIRTLIHAGADVNIKNNVGLRPIDVAPEKVAKVLAPYMPKEVEVQQNSADQLNRVMIGLLMVLVKSMPLNKEQQQIFNQAENILNGSDTHQPRSVAKSPSKRSKSQKSNERTE